MLINRLCPVVTVTYNSNFIHVWLDVYTYTEVLIVMHLSWREQCITQSFEMFSIEVSKLY